MQKFTTKIVEMMKSEGLFEWQGGPIILSQIENEFGPLEWDQGEPAKAYASWAANMAVALNTSVPWIMCKEDDAPDPIVCTVPLLFNTEYMYWGKQFLISLMFFVTVVQEMKGYDRSYIEFPLF
jgi:hypothetical protein